MSLPVVFTPEARAHIRQTQQYIAEASTTARAARYIARLRAAIRAIGDSPLVGTRRDDLAPGLRTTGFERRITIVFAATPTRVIIVAILYAGREAF